MEIIANKTEFRIERKTAAAIGKFDGMHIGHRRLLEEIISRKKDGMAACIFTFDPPPSFVFGTDKSELTTREEKRLLFKRMGVDILIEFPLNSRTAAMPPEVFASRILACQMNVCFLAAGKDLSFGAKGAGDAVLLQRIAPQLGFDFLAIDKISMDGAEVSSTLVRRRVEKGNMELAECLLGMPYMIAGKVEHGNKLGRTLGFPTINVYPAYTKLLPPNGVYFSQVRYKGRLYRAVSNVGCKPTVSGENVMGVETFLYDFSENIYGESVEIYLQSFHRPEKRFDSVEALRLQIQRDIAAGESRLLSKF